MPTFAAARRIMVDNQLRTSGLTDLAVLEAFDTVAREAFVPAGAEGLAYADRDVALGGGRSLARPAGIAKMIEAAEVRATDKVLVVGAGSGYSAAILAKLAASVVALEEDPALADKAEAALKAAGAANATVVTGPLAGGASAAGPFDVILVDGAVGVLPAAYEAQLAEGGRLVAVEGAGLSGRAMIHVRTGKDVAARYLFNLALPLLPGTEPAPTFVF